MDATAASVKRSRDEASKLLGEKMLQGWTMLGISCPVEDCYTPLMRSKQGKMYCVRCDQYVVTEEEAKKQQQEEETAAAETGEAEAQLEEERKRRIEQQFHLEEQAKQAKEMQELEMAKASRAAAAAHGSAPKRKIENAVPTGAADDAEVNALRRQTLAALYKKMGALTDSLSPNDHSERLASVAKVVREIAEAAQLLQQ